MEGYELQARIVAPRLVDGLDVGLGREGIVLTRRAWKLALDLGMGLLVALDVQGIFPTLRALKLALDVYRSFQNSYLCFGNGLIDGLHVGIGCNQWSESVAGSPCSKSFGQSLLCSTVKPKRPVSCWPWMYTWRVRGLSK